MAAALVLTLALSCAASQTAKHVPKSVADLVDAARHTHIARSSSVEGSEAKVVVLVSVTEEQVELFQNWHTHFRKLNIGTYIAVTEHQSVFDKLTGNEELHLKGRVLLAGTQGLNALVASSFPGQHAVSAASIPAARWPVVYAHALVNAGRL